MAFTIPGTAAAGFIQQASVMSTDFAILAAGAARYGVRSGCGVVAQFTPNMTTLVAAGVAEVAGEPVTVAGGSVTHLTADATNPRFDLVIVEDDGNLSVEDGTPAALPVLPAIPTACTVLAAVYVPAGATALAAANIIDKRVILNAPPARTTVFTNQHGSLTDSATFGAFGNGSAYTFVTTDSCGVKFTAIAPPGITGISAAKFRFSAGSTGTTNAFLQLEVTWGGTGELTSVNAPTLFSYTQAMPGVAFQIFELDFISAFGGLVITAGDVIQLWIQRRSLNAADVYANSVFYHGAILEWGT